ncbi:MULTISPECIES: response regulator [Microbacterium]|uniref:DNA-binding response regulator, NarL/FixJ family, contains REC and HTH domains n=1 Tax=Microbacterium saccharophilum TaxID=1213358 RepID=A0A7Z7GEU0_9MICO|nr:MULTISPECIES: response regulator transcription factor [Microbacterium]SFI71786.1 DNA-binding response regulator, NarL/FixJ family, contains REC and HTH domains [Microbacterium saccharophilum]
MTSVLVLDDHDLMRRGIADTIDSAPDFRVVAEAASAHQALARTQATSPDLAVLDMRLPDGDGAQVCRSIRAFSPATRCVVISSVDDDTARAAAAEAGAAAFLLKSIRAADLLEALRAVAAGRTLAATLRPRAAAAKTTTRRDAVALTGRETEILELIGAGLGNRQIGLRLGIAEKTVKNYITSLLRKIDVQSRTQAALYAVRRTLS